MPFDSMRVTFRVAYERLSAELPEIAGRRGYDTAAAVMWPFRVFDTPYQLRASVGVMLEKMTERGYLEKIKRFHYRVKPNAVASCVHAQ